MGVPRWPGNSTTHCGSEEASIRKRPSSFEQQKLLLGKDLSTFEHTAHTTSSRVAADKLVEAAFSQCFTDYLGV
ncbi:hypothetical protein TWF694_006483 [Orbilia ellipsospora]|uniref:Uncharacterized protein n=1 Tax=Orbilia ellipsospora TaxID=2528407 RepID=A0AAV9XKM2_9PEZI